MVIHSSSTVLLIEDSLEDGFLIRQSLNPFKAQLDLHQVRNLGEAYHYLSQALLSVQDETLNPDAPLPSCILLDLDLPDGSGLDLLDWIQHRPALQDVPIIVLTSQPKLITDGDQREGIALIMEKPITLDGYNLISETLASLLIAAGNKSAPSNDNDPSRANQAL